MDLQVGDLLLGSEREDPLLRAADWPAAQAEVPQEDPEDVRVGQGGLGGGEESSQGLRQAEALEEMADEGKGTELLGGDAEVVGHGGGEYLTVLLL